ncbi:MAG TPA: hypothetical protein VGK83_04725 [Acidimicrobiia bacterium]
MAYRLRVPLRNRVDPWGDLHAVSPRGTFTGNRGCLVDNDGEIVRHHQSNAWITCRLQFKDWRHPLAEPRTWTPLFFLDEAVALSAGHRPCAFCRREDFNRYRRAIAAVEGLAQPPGAKEIDQRLAAERLKPGRALVRAQDRKTWKAALASLPSGTVVAGNDGSPLLVDDDGLRAFGFEGWEQPISGGSDRLEVITPPTSVSALRGGFGSAPPSRSPET